MFADAMEGLEKRALLRLMAFLATVDGVVEEELSYIGHIAGYMGISPDGVFEEIEGKSLGELCAGFEREQAKIVTLVELLNIANADSDYTEAERQGIRNIAGLMDVDEAKVAELEGWVARGLAWKQEGMQLMGFS